jgi:hypothetical protein
MATSSTPPAGQQEHDGLPIDGNSQCRPACRVHEGPRVASTLPEMHRRAVRRRRVLEQCTTRRCEPQAGTWTTLRWHGPKHLRWTFLFHKLSFAVYWKTFGNPWHRYPAGSSLYFVEWAVWHTTQFFRVPDKIDTAMCFYGGTSCRVAFTECQHITTGNRQFAVRNLICREYISGAHGK